MAEIGVTEVGPTRQALVAALVQQTLKQRAQILGTVTDYSSFAIPGALSVAIPRRDQFAAADKTENTNLSKQEMTFATDVIPLSKHKAILASIERIAEVQANVSVESEVIMEMAAELALQVDKDLITELKLASAAAPDHILDYANTPTDTLQRQDIVNARKLLKEALVPDDGNRWMVMSPTQEAAVLQLDDFIHVEKYGVGAKALATGELGMIYGFRVMCHTELAAAESLFYHKSAVGYASQLNPEFKRDDDLDAVATKYLLHHIYGSKVLDSGKRQVFYNGTGV